MKSIIRNSDRNQNNYARSLIEASLDPLVTISAKGKITDVNEASVKVIGIPREKLIDTDFSNYFTDPKKAQEGYLQVFEKGFVTDYPLTIKNKNGNLTDVLYNASVYKDDKGSVLGVFASARDITEQKQASQYARSLIEASLDPLVTISAKGKITDVNEASVKVIGIPREKLIDTDFSNYFTDPKKAQEGYLQVFEKGFVTDYPLTIKNKNGNLTDVLYNASVYKDDKGNVLGVFASARDVTEIAFQNKEKEKRADELALANTELAFQNKEKEKRADELALANTELAFQNEEKEKRADELALANTELAFQNEEKEKRADELALANTELAFQNKEKEKRADELALANTELAFQNKEKEKRAEELALAKTELAFQNREKEKRADELILANKELAFQKKLEGYRSEMESLALELTLLIDTANAPIFGIDNKGLVNEWNQTSEKITGFTKDEVLGNDLVQTYITEDYRESVKKVLKNALKGEETANYEFPLFAKSGERVMVLLNSSTRRNAAGKITGVLGVGQDITEIDKLRTASESIAKELRQFIETANAPIFGIDAKGKVNEWNQTSEKITGFKKEEVLGKDLVETYITEDYREAVKLVLDNALKGKETANYKFPLFTKDGRRVVVLLNSSTRRDADGKIVGVLGVGQDISQMDNYKTNLEDTVKKRTFELENSLEREKELGKLKTSFVAMASHEFRTPLAAIQAATDVILRYKDKLSQEDIEKRLFKIKREVNDMKIMLEDILIIGKAESQKLQFNTIEQDLVDLVKNIVSDYQLTQENEREVLYKISMDKIMLNVDPKWIKHIIINLLSNALKYSKAPASIIIEIRQEENEVMLSFTDQGIGISEKDQESLFEPFHRGKNVGNIQGTGLGLSVLQTAIDLHKGKIKVESKLNNGSTFIVSLPFEGTI